MANSEGGICRRSVRLSRSSRLVVASDASDEDEDEEGEEEAVEAAEESSSSTLTLQSPTEEGDS